MTERINPESFASFEMQQRFFIDAIAANAHKDPALLTLPGLPWDRVREIMKAYYMTPEQIPQLSERFRISPRDLTLSIKTGLRNLYYSSPPRIRRLYDIRHFRANYSPLEKPKIEFPFKTVPPIPELETNTTEPEDSKADEDDPDDKGDITEVDRSIWQIFESQQMQAIAIYK